MPEIVPATVGAWLDDLLDAPRFRTEEPDYDKTKVGWKIKILAESPGTEVPGYERRKVYDTTRPGRGNGGHTYGDRLSEAERMAVIEYLKTL